MLFSHAAGLRSVIVVITALAELTPAGTPSAQAAAETVWLRGAGATFPAPLYKRWIEAYQNDHPNLSITFDGVGSSEGLNRFLTGSVDFAASDAAITDAQMAKVTDGVVTVPATAGMIVLAYNLPGLKASLRLPRDAYPEIFAGKLTRWDDPRLRAANPDIPLPQRTLAVVARLDGSGTTYAFSRHLDRISATWQGLGLAARTLIDWPGNTMLARGNEGVASRIKISEGSIGYVEYGFAKRLGLPMAALQNKSGQYVLPSDATGQAALSEATATTAGDLRLSAVDPEGAGSYPIVTYSWLLLYGRYADPAKAEALKTFVSWGLHDGQAIADDFGYIPLPSDIAARGREAIATIR